MALASYTTAPESAQTPTRRALLGAAFLATPAVLTAPALLEAANAETPEDPILAPYHAWCAARNDWWAAPGESAEADEAGDREWAAVDEMVAMTPTSLAGVAALAHLLWVTEGPVGITGTEEYEEQCGERGALIFAALWRFATGRKGLPPVRDAHLSPHEIETFAPPA